MFATIVIHAMVAVYVNIPMEYLIQVDLRTGLDKAPTHGHSNKEGLHNTS